MIYVDHCCLLVIFSINNLTVLESWIPVSVIIACQFRRRGDWRGNSPGSRLTRFQSGDSHSYKNEINFVKSFSFYSKWMASTDMFIYDTDLKPSLTGGMRLQWKRIWFWFKYHSTKHNPYDMQLNTFNLGQVPMTKKFLFVVHVYTKNRKIGI